MDLLDRRDRSLRAPGFAGQELRVGAVGTVPQLGQWREHIQRGVDRLCTAMISSR